MKTPKCPFLGKACIEHDCMLYTHIQMKDPQTGRDKDEWACSLALIPLMVIEGARVTRGVQAAVESMRNEVIDRQDTLNNLIVQASRRPAQIRDVGEAPAQIAGGRETDTK